MIELGCCELIFSSCREKGIPSSCGVRASHCSGLSRGGRDLGHVDSAVAAPRLQSPHSGAVVHGLSRSEACGIILDQGSNSCALHWQADSLPLSHQGSPSGPVLTRADPAGELCSITEPRRLGRGWGVAPRVRWQVSGPAAPRGSRSRFGGPPVVLRPVPAAGTWSWGATFLDKRTSFSVSFT